jgi:hypothetical protein
MTPERLPPASGPRITRRGREVYVVTDSKSLTRKEDLIPQPTNLAPGLTTAIETLVKSET